MAKHQCSNKSNCVLCPSAGGLTRRRLLGLSAGAVGPLLLSTTRNPILAALAEELTEIARGDVLHPALATRIDIYALAVMAFELLTGQPPFVGPTLPQLLQQHAFDEPKAPSLVCPELSPAFDGPLLQALAKDPADRPPSVELLRGAMLSALLLPRQTQSHSPG